jgi:hypothetical protein
MRNNFFERNQKNVIKNYFFVKGIKNVKKLKTNRALHLLRCGGHGLAALELEALQVEDEHGRGGVEGSENKKNV